LLRSHTAIDFVFEQPGVRRHDGLRYHVTRVVHVRAVPFIRVTATQASQVRTGTLGAPQERMLIYVLTGGGERAVTLSFSAERTYHLGDRKSTRLNSSHVKISYTVFCL